VKKDIERVFITHENKADNYPLVVDSIKKWIDQGVRVTIEPKQEKRSELQNKLAQVWKGQIAKQTHEKDLDAMWGTMKLDYLLPIKLADEKLHDEAVKEQVKVKGAAMAMAYEYPEKSAREWEIDAAFETIRSSSQEIGVRVFAEWLSTMQSVYSEQGIILESRREDVERALMIQAEERAA